MTSPAIPRVLVLWCPDWPITAARSIHHWPVDAPVALIANGIVYASSRSARAEGVRRGLRLREAQSRCPEVIALDYDPALDNRAFEPIIAAVEDLTPGVQVLRPGVCAVRVRGAAGYYGGETAAALALTMRMDDLGAGGARAGVADGIFTAEQAARLTGGTDAGGGNGGPGAGTVRIVAAGGSAEFLEHLPVGLLDDGGIAASEARGRRQPGERAGLITLLKRLGIGTLGEFAALGADDVRSRFGADGARLHTLAAGRDSWPLSPRTPPDDHDVTVDFEPALDRVDQVAFGVRTAAERFITQLTQSHLVCTAIRVALASDSSEIFERVWLHPRSFSPSDVVDRVRWQLQGSGEIDLALSSGITRVHILPEAVDAISHHETGLWGTGPDERIHHGLSRVQSMLGHGAVLMPAVGGGRSLLDRQQLVAWGDRAVGGHAASEPWPGQLPAPLPATVFAKRHPVHVTDASGAEVRVDARGGVTAPPAYFGSGAKRLRITAWAGPWPVDERWWSPDQARRAWRFQTVDDTGCAWLLVLDDSGWWAEARYD